MARSMTQAEIDKWLAGGSKPGVANVEAKFIDIDNPDFNRPGATTRASQTKEIQQITYTRNDGQKLIVLDKGEKTPGGAPAESDMGPVMPGEERPASLATTRPEPKFEVVGEGKPVKEDPADSRSPEEKRNAEIINGEREANLQDPNNQRWETNAQKSERVRQERQDAQAAEDRRLREQTAAQEALNRQKQLEIQERGEARAGRAEDRQVATSEAQVEIGRGNLTIAQQAEARAAAKDTREATRPQILGSPNDSSENIAVFDPTTNEVRAVSNPIYDRVKADATRKREELNLQIQLGKMQADQAAAEYNRWFKENVEVPFMRAAEARAQAQEQRAALQAEEQRKQFAATEARQRRAMGLQAGQEAVRAELQTLPYRVGPAFAGQFSSAVNSLAGGGNLNNNASAGINFTPDAFQFDRPDFQGISASATKDALKGLTNYSPAEGSFSTGDYSGINLPNAGTMGSAPAAPQIDFNSLINSVPYKPAT